MVTQASQCVCLVVQFLFLRGTPSAHRTGQLAVGGNRACRTNRKKENQTLKWQSVALVADWATTSPVHSPAFHSSPSSSTSSSFTQLWVIKLSGSEGGWVTGGVRVRGGDRVLTHRLSNGFQRPTTTRLCAVWGLIRSDGSPRLDSVKAVPCLSNGDMDSQPPPQDPHHLGNVG